MRRKRNRERNLTARKSPPPSAGGSEKRLKSLGERLIGIEERLLYVEANLGIHPPVPEQTRAKKRGPVPYPDEILFETRDSYVDWLEYYWPELHNHLFAANEKGSSNVEAALKRCAGPEDHWTPIVRSLIGKAVQLLEFVRSSRFRRKPPKLTVTTALNGRYGDPKRMKAAARLPTRQIANAMAGVPGLDWRTSLDRCAANPSRLLVGKKTEEYYRKLYAIPPPNTGQTKTEPSESVPKTC